jgi:hypothetical protein
MPSFKQTTRMTSAAHRSKRLRRRLTQASLRLGLWAIPVVCLLGALAVNGLSARLGWQQYLVLLGVGTLAGLFALAARRLLLAPQGKALLGFVSLALLLACWIAPAFGLVAVGALLTIGLLLSIAWLCKQLWEQAVLTKKKETKPGQRRPPTDGFLWKNEQAP